MNPIWIFWYMWFIMFVVILPAQRRKRKSRVLRQRKKGIKMTNEWAQKLIGNDVWLYGDNYSFKGTVKSVEGNWVTLEMKNGTERMVNLDFAYRIDILEKK